jgi:hypothetical protein
MAETRFRLALAALAAALLLGCGAKQTVWQKVIDTGGDETAAAIAADKMHFYVGGTVQSPGSDRSSWLIQKVTKDGKEIWTRTYKDAPRSACGDIAADQSGNLFVAGRAEVSGRQLCIVARYGFDGSMVWQKGLAIGDKSWGTGVCLLSGGRIAVSGVAGTDANTDHMVAVLDAGDGKTVWSRNYDICCTDIAQRIAANAKDELAVVGQFANKENTDIIIMKLSPKGDTLWTRLYDSGGNDTPGDIAFDPFGDILATGTAVVGDSTHCVILEYDPAGGVIRKAAYGEQAQATGNGIDVNAASDIFITGKLLGKEHSDALVFQYQPNALSVWERHYSPGGDAAGVDLVVPGDAFVAATVQGKTRDIAVFRFTRPLAKPEAPRGK